jgi:NTP pyrophosphatase (non-canonical NTP hydrolase)
MFLDAYKDFVEMTCKNAGFTTATRRDNKALGALLELQGELGEVTEIFQKASRRTGGRLSAEDVEKLHDELGDVLWGFMALLNSLEFDISDVARANYRKLEARRAGDHQL